MGCGDDAYNSIRMETLERVSGILWDRRIRFESQGESKYKTVVRPAIMYVAETWSVKKTQ